MKKKLDCMIWLVRLLVGQRLTLREIQDRWEHTGFSIDNKTLTDRTFRNYKTSIKDIFGINVECDGFNRYSIKDYSASKNDIKSWLLAVLSLEAVSKETLALRDKIQLEEIPSGHKYLTEIIGAIKESNYMKVEYQDFDWPAPVENVVGPCFLKVFHRRWYMIARIKGKRKLEKFALDRIQSLEILDEKFKPRKESASDFFSGYFGVVRDEANRLEELRLRVWDPHRRYLRSLPMMPDQKEEEIQADWSVFTYYMHLTWDVEMELLQHNDNVEVLSPESFRDKMIAHVKRMGKMYGITPEEYQKFIEEEET